MKALAILLWMDAVALAILLILLSGCAQPPQEAIIVHQKYSGLIAVPTKNGGTRFIHPAYGYATNKRRIDTTFTKEDNVGNCYRYAANYAKSLPGAKIKECTTAYGLHAYALYQGWALDNRFNYPVLESEVGCKK